MVGQTQHFGARLAGRGDGAVRGAIVNHQNGRSGHVLVDRPDHLADGAFFVEDRHDHQQRVGTNGADHSSATLLALMRYSASSRRNTAGIMRAAVRTRSDNLRF